MRFCLGLSLVMWLFTRGPTAHAADCETSVGRANRHGWMFYDIGSSERVPVKVGDKILLNLRAAVAGWPQPYLNGLIEGFTATGVRVSGGFETDWSNVNEEESYGFTPSADSVRPLHEVASYLVDQLVVSHLARRGKYPSHEVAAIAIKTPIEILWRIEGGLLVGIEDMPIALRLFHLVQRAQRPQLMITIFEEHFLLDRGGERRKWRDVFGHTNLTKDKDSKFRFLRRRFPATL